MEPRTLKDTLAQAQAQAERGDLVGARAALEAALAAPTELPAEDGWAARLLLAAVLEALGDAEAVAAVWELPFGEGEAAAAFGAQARLQAARAWRAAGQSERARAALIEAGEAAEAPWLLRALALLELADLELDRGALDGAVRYSGAVVTLAVEHGYPDLGAGAALIAARALAQQGSREEARRALDFGRSAYRTLRTFEQELIERSSVQIHAIGAGLLIQSALLHHTCGEIDGAADDLETWRSWFGAAGPPALALVEGLVLAARGAEGARAALQRAVREAAAGDEPSVQARALLELALRAERLGERVAWLEAAEGLVPDDAPVGRALAQARVDALLSGGDVEGARALLAAMDPGRMTSEEQSRVVRLRALTHLAAGELEPALHWLRVALDADRLRGDPHALADTQRVLAQTLRRIGQPGAAAAHLEQAAELLRGPDITLERALLAFADPDDPAAEDAWGELLALDTAALPPGLRATHALAIAALERRRGAFDRAPGVLRAARAALADQGFALQELGILLGIVHLGGQVEPTDAEQERLQELLEATGAPDTDVLAEPWRL